MARIFFLRPSNNSQEKNLISSWRLKTRDYLTNVSRQEFSYLQLIV